MKYSVEKNTVTLSLPELCEEALGISPVGERPEPSFFEKEKLLFGEGYEKNISLEGSLEGAEITYTLCGTADGLWISGNSRTVDLIRVVTPRDFSKPLKREWTALLRLLAYLLCLRDACDGVGVRAVLVNRENGNVRTVLKKYGRAELDGFARSLLALIAGKVRLLVERERVRRPSATNVPFPYVVIREGQEEMIRRGMATIRHGKRLFACAPTGIGKTISALYPAVRAFGKGYCDKIFYLTAKSVASQEAYRAAAKLVAAGANLRVVVLTAKEQICPVRKRAGMRCDARDCERMRGYSERSREALTELLARQNGFYASVISEVAARYTVCPYELSLDLSEVCDLIICDYNYLFDPSVHIRRYFDNPGRFGEYVFLIDEAHNLVNRARELYSVTLSRKHSEEVYALIPQENHELHEIFKPFIQALRDVEFLCHDNRETQPDGVQTGYYIGQNRVLALDRAVLTFSEKLGEWLRVNRDGDLFECLDSIWRDVSKYVSVLNRYDEKFITYVEMTGEDITASLTCIDPSDVVDECLDKGRAAILFSATLTPLSYFCDLLGGIKKAVMLELPSPYDPENLCVVAVDGISTRFEDRDKTSRKIASCIAATVSAKAGNYIAYFPSYGYMEKVHALFCKKYPGVCTVLQKKGMRASEKEEFLSSFKKDTGKLRIGFCVLGGVFSEGVDLPGSRLIGSIIVGVGLPGLSSERNIMRDYFQNRYENGFEYAYTYPGMNHVLQAAGRVIRCEEDRGIVVLIDDRYATPAYQKLFPPYWNHLQYAGNPSSLAEIARNFWKR